jgi:pyridoxal 5'-phosphate synthase pdxS subunit
MAAELPTTTNGTSTKNGETNGSNSQSVKEGLARMLKGGVIMDVVNAEQVSLQMIMLLLVSTYHPLFIFKPTI